MNKSSKTDYGLFLIPLGILLFLYLLHYFFPFRIDLTQDKRYSLHPATQEILQSLEEPLEVEILLTGNLPGGMRRLQKAIEETIRTFDAYSSYRISFRYFDPLSLQGEAQRDFILDLDDYGIRQTNLFASQYGGQTSRMIFPGILIKNEEYETGTLLLKGERGMSPDEILNLSIENLEFEISRAIKRLAFKNKYAIGMIINHGETDTDDGFGIVEALIEEHEIYKVPLDQAKTVDDLLGFEALIIAGPKESYSLREKYLLDQYLMHGGNLVFMVDQLQVSLQDAGGEGTVAMPFDTGLDDLLFRYGIRINRDFIQDLNFGYHPVVAGEFGDQTQIVPLPWPFYVLAGRMANHPITKGLNQLQFRFVSTLDTVKAEGVQKTPLVFSSDYSRVLQAPVRVAFEDMSEEPDVSQYQQKQLPLVYLLEGEFTSFFKNRFLPDGFESAGFKESGEYGKIIVAGDGDFLKSLTEPGSNTPLPLGEDPMAEGTLDNRIFLQNTINYLIEPEGIIASRTKQYPIRPLNKVKIQEQKSFWQFFNILVPILAIGITGLLKMYWRKIKYGKVSIS